jgi:hypothetical protein
MSIDMRDFSDLFLCGRDLQNVICHFCNQSTGACSDPITETLTIMATTPIAVVITEAGVSVFKNQPAMVIPYSAMNASQLLYLKHIVEALVRDSTESHLKMKGHVQMGGGCIVMIPSQKDQRDFIIDQKDLLHAFVEGIHTSVGYNNWTKKAFCGILIQRLACSVNLSKDIISTASSHAHLRFSGNDTSSTIPCH